MPILVSIVQKMKDAKVAPILATMKCRRAVALTEKLTARKQLSSAVDGAATAAARAPAPGAAKHAAPRAQ